MCIRDSYHNIEAIYQEFKYLMRIFDCTTFYSEHLMMDIRFHVLNDFVDKFIVCESTYSHSGKKKKLNFNINNYQKFKDKISGIALIVPVANGSCIDLTTEMDKMPSVEEANKSFEDASSNELKGLVRFTEDPIVSSDAIGGGETMLFDSKATMIASEKLLKTVAWFDNGWGFANRILELAEAYSKKERI